MRGDALIVGGEAYEVGFEIHNWHDHGMKFTPWSYRRGSTRLKSYNRPRRDKRVKQIVHHWTGGEGTERAVFNTLIRRKLGIHFFNRYDGVVFQYCDPVSLICAHASALNDFSLGIENQNRGWPTGSSARLRKKYPRGVFRDTLKGRSIAMCSFTSEQLGSAVELTETLLDVLEIEPHIPGDPELLAQGGPASGVILRDTIPREWNDEFEGVLGHYHASKKYCPGIQLLETLIDEEVVEPVVLEVE